MSSGSNSTISALCYAKPSYLDFRELTRELEESLCNHSELDAHLSSQSDDFVIFDMVGLRICVAYCDFRRDFPDIDCFRDFAECLVFSVGTGPDGNGHGQLFEHRSDVCLGLADRVQSRHPADELLMMEVDETVASDICGTIIDCIVPIVQKELERQRRATAGKAGVTAGSIVPTHPAANADSRAVVRRPRPKIDDANAQKDCFDRERVRIALYPSEDELPVPRLAKPLAHRAAINALNASVIAFSLPMGAVVLTCSILGRESLNLSARAMGLAGASLGVSQAEAGTQILAFLT
ncbi:hypothetical protein [Marivivens marinus]|uniref:hypothetical protein n=1 Tax=Marivivens marinus TaxID=3110173 RepID=UPI003B845AD7